ncbi:MAG: GNAT family N-acetyltransferase [Acidimicrobiales bacterium]
MAVEVVAATEVTDELVAAFAALVPQLSRSAPPPTRDQLAEMVSSPATTVFLARVPGEERDRRERAVVGTLTLALFRIPTGVRAWIEDVVVDSGARGQGVGEALTLAAVARARAGGARTVELTSRPSREAANRLYLRLGFALRDTNLYRLETGAATPPT